jgi:hypothetical protein
LSTVSSLLPHEVLQRNHPFVMSERGDLVWPQKTSCDEQYSVVGWGGRGGTLRGLVGFERYLRAEAERKSHEHS